MKENLLFMIIGMAFVTYLPRVLPFILFNKPLPTFIQNILANIPYAILGALIFPGVLHISDHIWYGCVGAIVAITIAYFGANVIYVILGSITVLAAWSMIG